MANVVFHLDAKQESAVRGFLQVVDAQKKADSQFGRTTRRMSTQDRMLKGMSTRAAGFAKSMLRLGPAMMGMAGAGSMAGGLALVSRGLDEAVTQTIALDREMTELFSLGDNVSNMDAIRKQVFDYAEAWGKSSAEISSAMFNLQSGTANLSKTQRNELMRSGLELNKFYGGELPASMNALIKTYQIYRSEGETVTDVQRKLAKAAEDGFLTFKDMADQFPDIASAGKAVGTSLDEMVSLLITATQRGGKTEKTFTGIRNVLLRLNNAEKEGIVLTGSLFDRLEQLQGLDPQMLKKIFGDESLAVAANLIELTDELRQNMEALSNSLPDIGAKLDQKMADPIAAMASTLEGLQQQGKTNRVRAQTSAVTGESGFVLRRESMKAGIMGTRAGLAGEHVAGGAATLAALLTTDTVKNSMAGRNSGIVNFMDQLMAKRGNPELRKQFSGAVNAGQLGKAGELQKMLPDLLPQTDPRQMLTARIAAQADAVRMLGGELPASLRSAAESDSAGGQYIMGSEVAQATAGVSSSNLAAMLTELRAAAAELSAAAKANASAASAQESAASNLNGATRKRRNAGGEGA